MSSRTANGDIFNNAAGRGADTDGGGGNSSSNGGGGSAREVWHCAVSLAVLRRFAAEVVQPGWTTYDVLNKVVLPTTETAKCRYVDTLPPHCSSTLTFFVSYTWSKPFADVVALLEHHLHAADPNQIFCWVDVLAVNQHPGKQKARDLQDLEEAVRLARGTLVCLDPECTAFSRIWCLFEWWTTLSVRGLRNLVFLADPATRRRLGELYQNIDVRKAQALVPSDRDRILAAIGDKLDLVNAQLKLIFLLEPYDTVSAVAAIPAMAPAPAAASRPAGSSANAAAADTAAPAAVVADWPGGVIREWLDLKPNDEHYRALVLVSPVGCGKSYGVRAALSTIAPVLQHPRSHEGAMSAVQGRRRRRPVAVHFCHAGDAASLDPLVMVHSLAFQLACQTRGSLAKLLQERYLELSRYGLEGLSRLDSAFNTLLLKPLAEVLPRPATEDAEDTIDVKDTEDEEDAEDVDVEEAERQLWLEWVKRQHHTKSAVCVPGASASSRSEPPRPLISYASAAPIRRSGGVRTAAASHVKVSAEEAEEAEEAKAPEEVMLVVDGLDEAEDPDGRLHGNRISLALRDLFSRFPPRIRLLVTLRPRPNRLLRSLVCKFDPWVASTPPQTPAQPPERQPEPLPRVSASPISPVPVPPFGGDVFITNWVLETIRGLLPPPSCPLSAVATTTTTNTSRTTTTPSTASDDQRPASLPAAYAALFTAGLAALSLEQRRGVGSLLELLMASPEPPSLRCITQMGLAPYMQHLPGWGVAFRVLEGTYRLNVLHRSLLEWLRGSKDEEDGWEGGGGGEDNAGQRSNGAVAVLGAAGLQLAASGGHRRLADWVMADLRGSARPQLYSLRYAILHLAHAAAAAAVGADKRGGCGEGDEGSSSRNSTSRPADQPASSSASSQPPSPPHSSALACAARVRQLDELLLDFDFWRQVYTSNLATAVLRDLITLQPGLDSPVARDVVRMIQRDHSTLQREPELIEQLAFETPLGSATRAAAARSRYRNGTICRPKSVGVTALSSSPKHQEHQEQQQQHQEACVVVAPVYRAWPACLALVNTKDDMFFMRRGNRKEVTAVRFSPDGSLIAAANGEGKVMLYDSASGERVLWLDGHKGYVRGIVFVSLDADVPHPETTGRCIGSNSNGIERAAAAVGSTAASRSINSSCSSGHGISGGGGGEVQRQPTHDEDSRYSQQQQQQQQQRRQHSQLLVASAGYDETIRLRDIFTGEQVACLCYHESPITSLCVSSDGGHMASTDKDGVVVIWRLKPAVSAAAAAAAIQALPTRGSHKPREASCCAFTPDGLMLASGGKDGCVRMWGVATGEKMGNVEAAADISAGYAASSLNAKTVTTTAAGGSEANNADTVKCVAFTADGASLLVGMSGGEIGVWRREPPSSLCLAQAQAGTKAPPGIPTRNPAMARRRDAEPRPGLSRGPATSWRLHLVFHGHASHVNALVAARDGRTVYSSGVDSTVRVWDLAEGRKLAVLYGHSFDVRGCDLSYDGRLLASASVDGSIRIWDARAAASNPAPRQHALGVVQMAVAPDKGYVVTASEDKTVGVWALPPPSALLAPPRSKTTPASEVRGVPTPRPTPPPAAKDEQQKQRRPPQDGEQQQLQQQEKGSRGGRGGGGGLGLMKRIKCYTRPVASVAVAPDGVTVASASGCQVRVHRLDRPKVPGLVLPSCHAKPVETLGFNAMGTRLASGCEDGKLAVWDAVAWKEQYFNSGGEAAAGDQPWHWPLLLWDSPAGTGEHMYSLAWSPTDDLIATGHHRNLIVISGLWLGREPRLLRHESYQPFDDTISDVRGLAWSGDGWWLAGGDSSGCARVWDITSGKQVAAVQHARGVWALAFDPLDRNLLATCPCDGTAVIWNLSDLRCPARVATLKGHQGFLRSVAFLTRPDSSPVTAAQAAAAAPGAQNTAVCRGGGGGGGGGVSRQIITAGMDATVRLWSYDEAVRRREVTYMCPWAVTGPR
ncbi:WD repeat-containing protein 49 [Pleodorina starrii]|uniref:WD repeat-containing protein 49 n=1 Tax=Pleodorina starrii TaxID=330485 RepID=A0A9W6F2R6_9CHLO|nr:WD repeat-containing protein 49 [Pleodorina starrii]GLC53506.1 WD repeat-containing protein 49 [Pleodorina starrii]GLC65798.1 WD repeat-containing protein 49 [Pleodorina starrii]